MQTAGQDDSSDADDDPTEAERRMPQPTGKPSIANFDAGFPLDGPKTAAAPPMPAGHPPAPPATGAPPATNPHLQRPAEAGRRGDSADAGSQACRRHDGRSAY